MMLVVYTKNNCPYCDMAKALLTEEEIEFETINIEDDDTAREFLISEGHRTMPQIYEDGKLYVEGGYTGLKTFLTEGKETVNIDDLGSL